MTIQYYQFKVREVYMNFDERGTSKWAVYNKFSHEVTILDKATRLDVEQWINENHEKTHPRRQA